MKQLTSHRVQGFKSTEITSFFTKARGLVHPVDLSIGVPYGEMTSLARDAAIMALHEGKTRYTPVGGPAELRAAIADKLVTQNGIPATLETTIVTAGVSAGLFLGMAAILNPGDEVIIPDPFFLAYRELPQIVDAKAVFLDTYPTFQIDPKKLRAAITPRTKMLILNSPNNPSGVVYGEELLTEIAAICSEHELVVISDEVYEDIIYDRAHISIGAFYPHTITLNGFSKNHAMTGLRVGYAHSTPEIIKAMIELEQFVFFANSSIAEYAALAAIELPTAEAMKHYRKNRDYILDNLSPKYLRSAGDGSFFFFLKHPHLSGSEFSELAMKSELIVIPGKFFSLNDEYFRISYAVPTKVLAQGIEILNDLV